jgi:hypothetical protein
MKAVKLSLLQVILLAGLTLGLPILVQGQFMFNPLALLAEAKRNVTRYSDNIKLSEATVNSITEDDETGIIRPQGAPDGRTPNERIRDLKEGIRGELAKAKTNQIPLKVATDQFGIALERYNKNRTPENLKNLQGIADQITKYRNLLDANFEVIKNMLRQITMIRRATDEKEWDKPDGKYKDEREALDYLWNALSGTKSPGPAPAKIPQAGDWQETNLVTKKTRPVKLVWDGQTLKATIGPRTFVGQAVNADSVELSHEITSPDDATVITGPIPRKVMAQAIAKNHLTYTYKLKATSATLLEGTYDGTFSIQWERGTLKLRKLEREAPQKVRWEAVTR